MLLRTVRYNRALRRVLSTVYLLLDLYLLLVQSVPTPSTTYQRRLDTLDCSCRDGESGRASVCVPRSFRHLSARASWSCYLLSK